MRLQTLLLLTVASFYGSAQSDVWVNIIDDGFGIPIQKTAPEIEVYHDTIYVATAPLTAAVNAKLWRSGDGMTSWEDVTPATIGSANSIHAFGKTDTGNVIWLGTGDASGTRIFRSTNGADWIAISDFGFGTPALKGACPNMMVYQGTGDTSPYLYAGAGSHGGGEPGEVWRIPYDSTSVTAWEKLVDFDTIDAAVDQITYFEVFDDKLIFGTNAGAEMWQTSDGTTFTQNMAVGNGFAPAEPNNSVLSAFEIFKDSLYITTTNFTDGGQLWRTGDLLTFELISGDAFGEGPAVNELRKPIVSHDYLWITGYTDTALSTGTPIWKSFNGTDWVQSNTNGFGDVLNNGQNPAIVGFGDFVYFCGPNYTSGAQVWRTEGFLDFEVETNNESIHLYPNPTSGFLNIRTSESIKKIKLFQMNGTLAQSFNTLSVSTVQLDISSLSKGVYLAEIELKSGRIIREKIQKN